MSSLLFVAAGFKPLFQKLDEHARSDIAARPREIDLQRHGSAGVSGVLEVRAMTLQEQQDVQYKCPFCKGKFKSTEELHEHACQARQAAMSEERPPKQKPRGEQKH